VRSARGHVSTGHIQGGLRVYEDGTLFPGPAKNPNFCWPAESYTHPALLVSEGETFRDRFDAKRRAIADYMHGSATSGFVGHDADHAASALQLWVLMGRYPRGTTPIGQAIALDPANLRHAENVAKQHIRDYVASKTPHQEDRSLADQLLGEYLSGGPPVISTLEDARTVHVNTARGRRVVFNNVGTSRNPHPGEIFVNKGALPHVNSRPAQPGNCERCSPGSLLRASTL
jgi:hypothetical protein